MEKEDGEEDEGEGWEEGEKRASDGRSEGEKGNKVFLTHCIYSLISLFNKLR